MNLSRPLSRPLALVGLILSSLVAPVPAIAAPSDIAFLSSYLGSWRGRGTLRSAKTESVACTLNLTDGNADRVNFSGRCAMAGTTLSIQGTIAYIDSARRYEAAMTSNVGFQGTAIGKRQGNGVVFSISERTTANGQNMDVSSVIALQNDGISVEFNVVDRGGNGSMAAKIPFSK